MGLKEAKDIYSVCYSKGISHHYSYLAETQRQMEK